MRTEESKCFLCIFFCLTFQSHVNIEYRDSEGSLPRADGNVEETGNLQGHVYEALSLNNFRQANLALC